MKLLNSLLGRMQGLKQLENDQEFLEDLVIPLLASLMGVLVLVTLI
ncbi:MAG TPA: hypothetical protein VLU73_02110 [Methylococcaceae bacterium]|jgi:hypothetical protein|nr:hypothetical protein [Methylococcaceae bacterium]